MSTDTSKDTWRLDICDGGYGGELSIDFDERLTVEDGSPDPYVSPVITWRMTVDSADGIRRALQSLHEIGDVMFAHGGEGPNGWECIDEGLGEALQQLLDAGLVDEAPDEHLGFTFHTPKVS